jgi:methyl halide transferase
MTPFDKKYWEQRYAEQKTGWDIGSVSTPLQQYIDGISNKNTKILIPGAGNAHEFDYLVKNDFKMVTVIDIATQPLENLRNRHPKAFHHQFIQTDFFTLDDTFDLVLEQTFFCALDPLLRPNYVKKMHEILIQNGILAGVMFNFELTNEGPPFGGSIAEYKSLFEPYFNIIKLEPCYNSIKPRDGKELFVILQKKDI